MQVTDEEIIKKLKIKTGDRVLDIGGSMMQHTKIRIDTLVDIIHPEEAPYGKTNLKAKKFVKIDLTREKLPFKDKEFDVVLCTHTLEDLSTPFLTLQEIQRVGKSGLIVTPSMGIDMEFSKIDYTDWLTGARRVPGQAHHKWFFIKRGGILEVIPKNYPILYTSNFQVIKWRGEKEMVHYWKDSILYKEFTGLNINSLIDKYVNFIKANKKDLELGNTLIFIDNPIYFVKAVVKKLLSKGEGYKYRKSY